MLHVWIRAGSSAIFGTGSLLVLASINLFTIESCRLRYSRISPAGRVVGLSLRCAKAEKTVSRCAQHMSRELTRMVSLLRVFLSTMTRHGYTHGYQSCPD